MRRKIPMVLLRAVLVALIGGIDTSCSSGPGGIYQAVGQENTTPDDLGFPSSTFNEFQVDESTFPGRVSRSFCRFSIKDAIKLSLVGLIALFATGFALHRKNYNPAKYDIENEAEQVSYALGSSSASTQEKLNYITNALCRRLSGATTEPLLNISTLAGTTSRGTTNEVSTTVIDTTEASTIVIDSTEVYTTKIDTTEARTTEVDIMEVPTTVTPIEEVITTLGATSEAPTIPVSTDLCTEVVANVFPLVKCLIGDLRDGFVGFDKLSSGHKDDIRRELEKTAGKNCKEGFFRHESFHTREGVWFKHENEFIKMPMDDYLCKKATEAIIPILDEFRVNTTWDCHNYCILSDITDEMNSKLHEVVKIADGAECGYFYFYYDSSNRRLSYYKKNTYISDGLIKYTKHKECQHKAHEVISLLLEAGLDDDYTHVTKTTFDYDERRERLEEANALCADCYCGEGFFNVEELEDRIIYRFDQTNPIIAKAFPLVKEINACTTTGTDITKLIKRLNLYSPDKYVTLIVPDRNNNRVRLLKLLHATDGYDCKKGFFHFETEGADFKVMFENNNKYIQPEWEKIDNAEKCRMTARGVFTVFKVLGIYGTPNNNFIQFRQKPSYRRELLAYLKISEGLDCGGRWFQVFEHSNYVGLKYHTTNIYINPQWMNMDDW